MQNTEGNSCEWNNRHLSKTVRSCKIQKEIALTGKKQHLSKKLRSCKMQKEIAVTEKKKKKERKAKN